MKKIVIGLVIVVTIGIMFLLYNIIQNSNENKINFSLIGDKNITIYENTNYTDEGVSAYFSNGKTLKEYVKIVNNVNTNVIGNYEIEYTLEYKNVTKKLTRYINVISDPIKEISLILNDKSTVYILKGNLYVESGATAIDKQEGELKNIRIEESINTNELGTYEVEYTVTNSQGISKSITRKVIVYDFDYDVITRRENDKIKLIFYTTNEYIKGISIDEREYETKKLEYNLTEDKEYIVRVLDIYGNYKEKKYDLKKPIVSCSGEVTMAGTNVSINASDESGLRTYYYYLNGTKSELNSNSYNTTDYIDNVSVEVIDNNDNISKKIDCNVVNNVPYYDSGVIKVSRSQANYSGLGGYYLYVPKNVRLYEKMPLMVFLHGAGEDGDNLNEVIKYGPGKKIVKEKKDYNAFVLIPQSLENWDQKGSIASLHKLLEDIRVKYNIDENKISASGFSRGSTGVVVYSKSYPNYFSAGLLVSFGGRGASYVQYVKDMPLQFVHEKGDYFSYSEDSKEFLDKIKVVGTQTTITIFPSNEGHSGDFVDIIFSDDTYVDWLLSQVRKQKS